MLTNEQREAAKLLSEGTSKAEVARRMGVNRTSVYYWCSKSEFQEILGRHVQLAEPPEPPPPPEPSPQQSRREANQEVVDKVDELSLIALEKMGELIRNDAQPKVQTEVLEQVRKWRNDLNMNNTPDDSVEDGLEKLIAGAQQFNQTNNYYSDSGEKTIDGEVSS
jgi:transposase-like protein